MAEIAPAEHQRRHDARSLVVRRKHPGDGLQQIGIDRRLDARGKRTYFNFTEGPDDLLRAPPASRRASSPARRDRPTEDARTQGTDHVEPWHSTIVGVA
jgi:hypothetical protein